MSLAQKILPYVVAPFLTLSGACSMSYFANVVMDSSLRSGLQTTAELNALKWQKEKHNALWGFLATDASYTYLTDYKGDYTNNLKVGFGVGFTDGEGAGQIFFRFGKVLEGRERLSLADSTAEMAFEIDSIFLPKLNLGLRLGVSYQGKTNMIAPSNPVANFQGIIGIIYSPGYYEEHKMR